MNGMKELVSIIVPIFNKENTIIRCVDSIINQTYSNIEILLIDDGSTDSTPIIYKTLEEKDSRIRVFRQPNSGPGSARNLGIDKSNGEYLVFVDADDYLNNQMIEGLYQCAKCNSVDLVICGYCSINGEGKVISKTFEETGRCDESRLLKILAKWNINPLVGAPWNKLYKRSVIIDNHIRFPIHQTWAEDLQYNLYVYRNKPNIYILDSCLYYYTIGESSLTSENNSSKEKLLMMLPAVKGLCKSYLDIYGTDESIDFQHIVIMLYRFSLRISVKTLDFQTYYAFIHQLGDDNYLSKNTVCLKNGFSYSDIVLCRSLCYHLSFLIALSEKIRVRLKYLLKKVILK